MKQVFQATKLITSIFLYFAMIKLLFIVGLLSGCVFGQRGSFQGTSNKPLCAIQGNYVNKTCLTVNANTGKFIDTHCFHLFLSRLSNHSVSMIEIVAARRVTQVPESASLMQIY